MRLLIFLILFESFIVQCYDINEFIPIESVKQKVAPFINIIRFFKSNMTNQDFYDMVPADQQKWIFDRLATRNDLIRILKIILKIITFKKIAKFFIITGFLFFLPVMNTNNLESQNVLYDSDDFDFYAYINKTDYRSVERWNFFTHSLEAFSNPLMVWCVAEHDAYCRFQLMFDIIDQLYPFDNLLNRFMPNSTIFQMQWMVDKVPTRIRNVLTGKGFYHDDDDQIDAESEEQESEESAESDEYDDEEDD